MWSGWPKTRALGIAQQILGASASAFRAMLFEKLPDSNWLAAWHQNAALPLRDKRGVAGWASWPVKEGVNYAHAPARAVAKVAALRVHLDNSAADNGSFSSFAKELTLGGADRR